MITTDHLKWQITKQTRPHSNLRCTCRFSSEAITQIDSLAVWASLQLSFITKWEGRGRQVWVGLFLFHQYTIGHTSPSVPQRLLALQSLTHTHLTVGQRHSQWEEINAYFQLKLVKKKKKKTPLASLEGLKMLSTNPSHTLGIIITRMKHLSLTLASPHSSFKSSLACATVTTPSFHAALWNCSNGFQFTPHKHS